MNDGARTAASTTPPSPADYLSCGAAGGVVDGPVGVNREPAGGAVGPGGMGAGKGTPAGPIVSLQELFYLAQSAEADPDLWPTLVLRLSPGVVVGLARVGIVVDRLVDPPPDDHRPTAARMRDVTRASTLLAGLLESGS